MLDTNEVAISCLKFILPFHTYNRLFGAESFLKSWQLLSWSISSTWMFTSARNLSLLQVKLIQSMPSYSIYVRSIVIHFCLCVGHPNGLLSPGLWPKLCMHFLLPQYVLHDLLISFFWASPPKYYTCHMMMMMMIAVWLMKLLQAHHYQCTFSTCHTVYVDCKVCWLPEVWYCLRLRSKDLNPQQYCCENLKSWLQSAVVGQFKIGICVHKHSFIWCALWS